MYVIVLHTDSWLKTILILKKIQYLFRKYKVTNVLIVILLTGLLVVSYELGEVFARVFIHDSVMLVKCYEMR